jgi:PAS domain S-box-containing protein
VPHFICPNCKERSIDSDGLESLLDKQAVGCHRCGFGFLFELMDDYYPAPTTGFVVCDREGRVLALGRGVFELTGYREGDVMGKDVVDALRISGFEEAKNPVKLALEWGVRRLGEDLELTAASGARRTVKADVFPAYDADGGLLVALTPR